MLSPQAKEALRRRVVHAVVEQGMRPAQAVCQLLAERFGLRVSVWTAGPYLRRWGLTPQKPVRRA